MAKIIDWVSENVFFADRLNLAEKKSISPDQVRAELMGLQQDSLDQNVTMDTALQCATVLACVRVIAEDVAQLPCRLLRPSATGGKEDAFDHPVYQLVHRKPNDWQTAFEFWEQVAIHLALTFNAYIFVNRNSSGVPIEFYAYDPRLVTLARSGYANRYFITDAKGKKIEIPPENMWHIKGASIDGFVGLDAIKAARETIGLSLATVRFGNSLFRNGARPSGLLSTDQDLKAEQLQALKQAWEMAHIGSSNHMKTAVLGNGIKYAPMSFNADEAQFIETRKLQIEEICRVYRVQPVMIGHQDKGVSYNSIEQLQLSHLLHTLGPVLQRLEQSAMNHLLTDAELKAGFHFKFDTKNMMKGSAQERATYYGVMRANGLMTINECREAEDMDRVNDPLADKLTPAANLFGNPTPTPNTSEDIAK